MTEQNSIDTRPHVVVVGAGIAGLTTAFSLRHEPVRLTVLDAATGVGGKLSVSDVAGVPVDEGAEAIYARRAKTTGLIAEAGMGEDIASAGATAMATWSGGRFQALPSRLFMGVPADLAELADSGVLSDEGLSRCREDESSPVGLDDDATVAGYVGHRLGREVVDRLVDPFISGVYSGSSDELSFHATLTPLVTATRKFSSLLRAASTLMPAPRAASGPAVATIAGGLGTLPARLARAVLDDSAASQVRTAAEAVALAATIEGRWQLTLAGGETLVADGVVIAVPARPAARLLRGVDPTAAAHLAGVAYADLATVTLAYPHGALPAAVTRFGGYRVPFIEGRAVKEVTFTTAKWPHLAGTYDIVKCSVGRSGVDHLLQRDDAELATVAAAELASATGVHGRPVSVRVTRWDEALPQYTVGHLARVSRVQTAVAAAPGLAVCGAAYEGVGVGVCMTTGRRAAEQVLAHVLTGEAVRSAG